MSDRRKQPEAGRRNTIPFVRTLSIERRKCICIAGRRIKQRRFGRRDRREP